METLEPILKEHPFLKDLVPAHLKLLTSCAKNVTFDAGEFILREGVEANEFYIIRQGKVALEIYSPNQGAIRIDTIDDGEVLGWSWLIPPHHWRFDARALTFTRAIALDGKCMRQKCEHDHHLGFELLKRFANIMEQRLQATRLQLLDLYHDK